MNKLKSLTERQLEVVALASLGLTSKEVAKKLFLSVKTVNMHLYIARAKLGVRNKVEMARVYMQEHRR